MDTFYTPNFSGSDQFKSAPPPIHPLPTAHFCSICYDCCEVGQSLGENDMTGQLHATTNTHQAESNVAALTYIQRVSITYLGHCLLLRYFENINISQLKSLLDLTGLRHCLETFLLLGVLASE